MDLLRILNYILEGASILLCVVLLARLRSNKKEQEELHTSRQRLEDERLEAVQTLQRSQEELTGEIISALSSAVEAKDRYTIGHSQRVARYAREIARRLGWDEDELQKVYYAGLLHDVGKIRVPDTIINKEGRLNDEEFAAVKLHTMTGYYILKGISSVCDFAIGARWHHEHWNGTGYPNGLSGENIPVIARIICVADAYDAMTSNRSYRNVMPQAVVRNEIVRGAGTHFDPEIASIMVSMIDADTDYRMRQPDANTERVILAIDDDPVVHKLLEHMLSKEPLYQLKSALSGEEGLSLIQRERVDLVLLDMEMPGLNGFDVLRWVRENRCDLPVIFMTGDKEIDVIQKAEELGVSDYLTKPLVAHMLIESIQNVLLSARLTWRGWEAP